MDFRLIGAKADLDCVEPRVLGILGANVVSADGAGIEEWLVDTLSRRGLTVSTAESCSGGLLASRITDAPGSSAVFRRGFVTYSNEAKTELLGVPAESIARHGAVSREVSTAMAEGAKEKAGSDYALALTGIAGPGGGTPEKPVGLVFISLARPGGGTICREARFPADRTTFKQLATQAALDMLRRDLMGL